MIDVMMFGIFLWFVMLIWSTDVEKPSRLFWKVTGLIFGTIIPVTIYYVVDWLINIVEDPILQWFYSSFFMALLLLWIYAGIKIAPAFGSWFPQESPQESPPKEQ